MPKNVVSSGRYNKIPRVASGSVEDSRTRLFIISFGWQWLAVATPQTAGPQHVDTSWLLFLHHPICYMRATLGEAGRSWPAYNLRASVCTYYIRAGRRWRLGAAEEARLAFPREMSKKGFLPNPFSTPADTGIPPFEYITYLSEPEFLYLYERQRSY